MFGEESSRSIPFRKPETFLNDCIVAEIRLDQTGFFDCLKSESSFHEDILKEFLKKLIKISWKYRRYFETTRVTEEAILQKYSRDRGILRSNNF